MSRKEAAVLALLSGLLGAGLAEARDNGKASNRAEINASRNTVGSPAWCKANGNPNAAECPIFAPGSTAPNAYNANQPAPAANQLPQVPQQPTAGSLPMKWVAPAQPSQGALSAPMSSTTGASPAPPPPVGAAPTAAPVPPPAVGQPMPDAPAVTPSAEIANYGSFDANGNFNLNPGVAANTPTNFFQIKPNGTRTEMNVGQLKMFLGRGLLNRDGSVPAGSPLPIVHTPPPSLAAQFPSGTRMVPADQVSSGGLQNIMPGGAGTPLAAAEIARIGLAGGGVPANPQGLTSFYNVRTVDGKSAYVQMTQSEVATAVRAGMLRPDGSWRTQNEGAFQGTVGRVDASGAGTFRPTVIFLPAPPVAPPQLTPPSPSAPQAPPVQAYNVPTPMPGYVAYPHYVGPRDPQTGYPTPPQPPQQLTPPSPGAPQAPPLQAYNVPTPMAVPPMPQQLTPPPPGAPQAPPQQVYNVPTPMAVPPTPQQLTPPPPGAPQAPPQQAYNVPTPMAVPPMPQQLTPPPPGAPQAPPQQAYNVPKPMGVPPMPQQMTPPSPGAAQAPPQIAYAAPVPTQQIDVPRPRPLQTQANPTPTGQATVKPTPTGAATVKVTPQGGGTHPGADFITVKSGRQAPTAIPVFEDKSSGDRWHCVASGHHIRKVFDDSGNEVYAGALPGVAIQVVPIIRDVPAWHDLSSECLISVGEHPKAKAARR